jgi:chaperonin GroEL
MVVKQILFDESGREKLKSGIRTISKAVGSTLGPCGNTVLMESENHIGGITVTKDGVSVAKGINLMDPVENLAVQLVRQAASQTAIQAGDGTTTSVVLTEAIINAAETHISEKNNLTEVLRHIGTIAGKMDANLVKASKQVSGKRLLDVATISSNNDPVLGKLIADTYAQVSHVTVENSKTTKTYTEVVNGIKVDRGFSSRFFVNDIKKNECVLNNPYILITNQEITNLEHMVGVLGPIIEKGESLLIIGQLNLATMGTLNKNVYEGRIKAANIIPPSMGYRQDELMTDLAIALGGHFFSTTTGDNIANVRLEDLGRASKVIVGMDKTIIVPMDDENLALEDHVADLSMSIQDKTDQEDIEFTKERVANISGGVGVIYVGANSDIEQKELKDRTDDAVLAVKAALEEGVLPGGGIALMNSSKNWPEIGSNIDYDSAAYIMHDAVIVPFATIMRNAGRDHIEIGMKLDEGGTPNYGYDVKSDKFGDMIKMGIIDPTKVTRTALKNAVSVATTILSTNAIITNIRDYEGSK